MKTQDVATLAEDTVQKVARGEHVTPRRRRKASSAGRNGTLHTVRLDDLDPRVLAEVRRIGAEITRVQILAPDDVIVWNGSDWPSPSPRTSSHRRTTSRSPR